MFCMKCGSDIPENTAACPNCGQPVEDKAPETVPSAVPVVAPVVAASNSGSANTSFDIVGFLKDFIKDPVESCISRAKSQHFLLGTACVALYLVLCFIFDLINEIEVGHAVCYFFIDLIAIAGMIAFIFLCSPAFKVKKLDFLSTVAWVGLSFFPSCVLRIVAFINTKLLNAAGNPVFSISSILNGIALIFIYVVLYDFFVTNKEEKGTKFNAITFLMASYAVWQLLSTILNWCYLKMIY